MLAMNKMIVVLCMFGFALYPQTAKDFTATDQNGVEYKLFDLLDEGKNVIVHHVGTF